MSRGLVYALCFLLKLACAGQCSSAKLPQRLTGHEARR
jgi:hypothetical protein